MTRPFIRTGCIVIDAVGAMKLRFAATASGTPIECPPPRTSETVGVDIPAMSSAIASPASTSPPTVLSSISSPVISGLSSIAASNTHRWFGAYGVTKSAVDHLVGLAADELGASGVRVNGIRPGLIETDLVAPILSDPAIAEDYRVNTPLPRVGRVEDIAEAAAFLLGDGSTWITGQVINVDGGQMLRRGPDFSSMLEPLFGADGLRGVVADED